ncbi:ABC transporter substrate-binding protein [Jiangella endophytica]|uniref:ABC transporter substrate-binding protein n=1 Tax=Jiangella endophytica TaxID=1623398 RepID=UPI000E351056|nr:ABC transporter substrate-binding protein [Jiangella endophytica]
MYERRITRAGAPAIGLAAVLALGACGSDDGTEDAGSAGAGGATTAESLRIGIMSEEGNLTPHTYATGFPGLNLTMLSYDSLMQIDENGQPQPWLAETVEGSADGLSYTIGLADGVTWHDGEALTADDVAFSVQYYQAGPPGRFATALGNITQAVAQDESTVVLTLAAPDPSFELRTLADVPILPEHVWSGVADPDVAPFDETTNVGSGPYRLVESDPGVSYSFEANPEYFRGEPKVDELVVVQFADEAGATAALRSGEIDTMMRSVSPEQIDVLRGTGTLDVVEAPEYTTTLLVFDTAVAPFDQAEFRRAVALAVDRQRLVDDVFLGAAVVGNAGWVHPDSPWYDESVETVHDPEEAAGLLDGLGLTDSDSDGIRELDGAPLSFELLVASNNALRMRLAELIGEQLGEVGIDIEVSSVEMQTLDDAVWPGYDVAQGRNYELAMWGWSAPSQADIGQMASLVATDPAIGNLNITGYSDPGTDALAAQLDTELDTTAREQVADELQQRIAEEVPFVSLLHPNGAYGYNPDVFGDWVSITGSGPMTKLSFIPGDGQP